MQVIDLSQPLGPATTPWPGQEPFSARVDATVATDGYFIRRIDISEHGASARLAPGDEVFFKLPQVCIMRNFVIVS